MSHMIMSLMWTIHTCNWWHDSDVTFC